MNLGPYACQREAVAMTRSEDLAKVGNYLVIASIHTAVLQLFCHKEYLRQHLMAQILARVAPADGAGRCTMKERTWLRGCCSTPLPKQPAGQTTGFRLVWTRSKTGGGGG